MNAWSGKNVALIVMENYNHVPCFSCSLISVWKVKSTFYRCHVDIHSLSMSPGVAVVPFYFLFSEKKEVFFKIVFLFLLADSVFLLWSKYHSEHPLAVLMLYLKQPIDQPRLNYLFSGWQYSLYILHMLIVLLSLNTKKEHTRTFHCSTSHLQWRTDSSVEVLFYISTIICQMSF